MCLDFQIIFEKENDPTVLRSSCAGKLLTYEAEDGELLSPGQIYASMESMKVVLDMRVKKVLVIRENLRLLD